MKRKVVESGSSWEAGPGLDQGVHRVRRALEGQLSALSFSSPFHSFQQDKAAFFYLSPPESLLFCWCVSFLPDQHSALWLQGLAFCSSGDLGACLVPGP